MTGSVNPSKQPIEENLIYQLERMFAHEFCFELLTDLFSQLFQTYRFN